MNYFQVNLFLSLTSLSTIAQINTFPTPTGNVGINVSNPIAQLEMAGTFRVRESSTNLEAGDIAIYNLPGETYGIAFRPYDPTFNGGAFNWHHDFGYNADEGYWYSENGFRVPTGKMAIGSWNPYQFSMLDIAGPYSADNFDAQLHLHSSNANYGMFLGSHSNVYGVISQGGHYHSAGNFRARSQYVSGIIQNNGYIHLFSNSGLTDSETFAPDIRFTVKNDGNVGIGTTTPTHKLEVNGTVRSQEVLVEASPWPDYVFEDDYILQPLEETEAYIKEHKHLPEIPSAEEMEANGVELGEMNRLLLKKIEELTLHQINLQKRLEEQNQKINELQNQIR